MKAVGVIVEYNPFHNGHKLHLAKARRAAGLEAAVGVMSGNFVQRGEPAFFDKWSRAEMAVRGGLDLVIELPALLAVRSAQYFAAGAVRLLGSLGVVSHVAFGAENADPALLGALAGALSDKGTTENLHARLAAGQPYAAALGGALAESTGLPAAAAASPNNILAVEYLRAIEKYAPALKPVPIARQGADHHDSAVSGALASATAVRRAYLAGDPQALLAVPPASAQLMTALAAEGRGPLTLGAFETLALARLRTAALAELEELPEVNEGLQYKISGAALQATGLDELLRLLKTRRYSLTRLQRIMIHALLGTTRRQTRQADASGPLYARVLAFNDRGRELLREIGRQGNIPLITKTSRFLDSRRRAAGPLCLLQAMLAVDTAATDLYFLALPERRLRRGGWDFILSPRYIPCR